MSGVELMARARGLLTLLGPLLGLAAVVLVFSLDPDVRQYFLTTRNLVLILSQTAVVAMGAIGMTMIIVSGGIDLSVGSVVALSGVVCATALVEGAGAGPALTLAVLCGGLVGLANGALVGYLRMVPFIVTLGMMGVARGAAKWLSGSQTVNPAMSDLTGIMSTAAPGGSLTVPAGVWLVLGLALAMSLLLNRTVPGRHVYAVGSSEPVARLAGIDVPRLKLWVYGLAGMCFGLAGVLQFSRLTQGDPTVAIGLELDVIAAVVIGGASLSGGTGSVAGALIGALIMAVLRNGSNQMGWPNYVQEMMIGAVIVVAVGLDRLRRRETA